MKLYSISGLGADQRVFDYLDLDAEIIPLHWITHKEEESLIDYAERLSLKINVSEDFGLIGVSFGGLIATEISKKLNPKLTILISSIETKNELRAIYKFFNKTKLINLIPYQLLDPPRQIAYWLFGAKNKQLLKKILDDTNLKFAKWCLKNLLAWSNETKIENPKLKICGTKDKLLPTSNEKNVHRIIGGTHFMIVDRATEISAVINEYLTKKELL